MGILSSAGKDAGLSAAEQVGKTVSDAIPAAAQAVKDAEDHATYSIAGIVADVANRLRGAELPIDLSLTVSAISIRLQGKIGPLKLTTPDYQE